MKSLLLFFSLSALPLSLWADRIVGNGGDVLVCQGEVSKTFEALDLFEARDDRGWNIEYPRPSSSALEIARQIIFRLQSTSPQRSKTYLKWLESFTAEASFKDNTTLTDIDDSHHLYLPNNCYLKQIVIQRTPYLPGEKRYVVDNDLWIQLDATQQAAIILHELIFREYIELHGGQVADSRAVRYFNSLLWANTIESYSFIEFISLMQTLRLEYVELLGVKIKVYSPEDDLNEEQLWDPEFYDSGALQSVKVVEWQVVQQGGIEWQLADTPEHLPWQNTLWFFENGKIEMLTLWGVQKIIFKETELNVWGRVFFYDSGSLKKVQLAGFHEIEVDGEKKMISGEIEFSPEGKIIQ